MKDQNQDRRQCSYVENKRHRGTLNAIKELADEEGRSLSDYIGIILFNHAKKHKKLK